MKIAKRLLLILMSAIMMIEGGGCSMFVSESQLKKTLENSLKEKYGEEFVCLDVWSNGGSSYWGVCCPKDNRELLFETLFSNDGHISYDKYSSTIVSKELANKLYDQLNGIFQEYYVYCYNFGIADDLDTAKKIKDDVFFLEDFLKCMKEQSDSSLPISFRVCINTDSGIQATYEEEYERLNQAMNYIDQIGNIYDVNFKLMYFLYFLPSDIYQESVNFFYENAYPRTNFEYITLGENRSLNRCIRMDYDENIKPFSCENESTPITQEDYAEMRSVLE